jgi:hypothetical protein
VDKHTERLIDIYSFMKSALELCEVEVIEAQPPESIKKLGVTCLSGVKCASQSVHPRWEDTP